MNKYKFSKGLIKGAVVIVVFSIPFLIDAFPMWANLTLGGAGMMLVNYLKVTYIKIQ